MKKIIVIAILLMALLAINSTLPSASAEGSQSSVTLSGATLCGEAVTMSVMASGLEPSVGFSLEDLDDQWASWGIGGVGFDTDSEGGFTGSVKLVDVGGIVPTPTRLVLSVFTDDPDANDPWVSEDITVSVANCNAPPTTQPPTTEPPTTQPPTTEPPTTQPPTTEPPTTQPPTTEPPTIKKSSKPKTALMTTL
ncbi:hypothetical protein HY003_00760 [Candidatus Saccharibacteria bacterium]|nr:hypothetical protein [Candidatus Saccharibacteria bacterium]MBI3337813.1 hypothetical protein [Candidatus Saccharibacteria bacterium]